MTLVWSPSSDTNVVGYYVYYGGASRTYTNRIDAGDSTSVVISGLAEGVTYYFAATAYNIIGMESDFSAEVPYTVPIVPVNQPPTLNALSNLDIPEDAGPQTVTLSGISSGAANETQTLTVTAISSNPGLIPHPTVNYTSPNSSGTLVFAPAADASGSATITVTVNDNIGSNNIVSRTFSVTVDPVNDSPTLNPLGNIVINEDEGVQTVNLGGISSGAANEPQALTVTASSSNTGLIPAPTVSYSSPNASGVLTFAPTANAFGTATITVSVNDGGGTGNLVTRTFTVTVNPVNDAPTLNAIDDLSVQESSGLRSVSLGGIGSGAPNESQSLSVSATSSNPGLIPNPAVSYKSPNATGTLTFTPVANVSGEAVVTVTVNDGGQSNNITTRSFTVTVNEVNQAPTLNAIGNVSIAEDSGARAVNLAGITSGSANEQQTLTVTAVTSNPGLLEAPVITYNSPDSTGTLTLRPVENMFGTATVTVTVNDGAVSNNVVSRSFTVTVVSVNDVPTLNALANRQVVEDSGPQVVDLSGISSGAPNESQNLTVTAASSNTGLIPNPTISYASPNAAGTLTFTPVANAFGTATISVDVRDGGASNNVVTRTFVVAVDPANDAPTLNAPANVAIPQNAGQQTVNLSGIGSGAVNESQTLTVTAVSSSPVLVPHPTVNYTSPGATGTLTFTPVADASGVVTITVTVNDGGSSNNVITRTFNVAVNAVNQMPTLDPIASLSLIENSGPTVVNLSGISSGSANESQVLTITAASSNPTLIPTPVIHYTSPNTAGTLEFTPTANAHGSATLTVTVNDGGASNNIVTRTFTVTVAPVNNPPTLNAIGDLTLLEDAGVRTVTLGGISSGAANEPQALTVSASSSNPGLIPNPTVTYTSPNATGTLTFTPVANAFGTATLTVTVNDGGASNNVVTRSFSVLIQPVNDAPTLNSLANVSVPQNSGQQTVTLGGISPGAANETELLVVAAVSSSPSLVPHPTVNYTSPNATGSLTFTPVADASGVATITVTVNDGGASNNVVTRIFNVAVNAVNQTPTLDPIGDLNLPENSGPTVVNLSGISSGSPNESQVLTVTAASSNPGLIPAPVISYTSPSASGNLVVTPATNAYGSATVTVTLNDGGASNNIVTRTFTVTVAPVNNPPTLNSLGNLTLLEDAGSQTVNLGGISSGAANESQTLTVSASSSNTGLIPNPTVTYSSPNATGSLVFTPVANAFGTATITVTVNDGGASNNVITRTFTVAVNGVNDAPTLNALSNLSLAVNAGVQTVSLSGISSGAANEVQSLVVTATSSNPSLIPNPTVNYTSPNATGTLNFTPNANMSGSATITVSLNDGGASNNIVTRSFMVTINAVNQAPTLNAIANISLPENGTRTVNLAGISSGATNELQTLTVTATSSNPNVVPNPAVNYTSPNTTGSLVIAPAPNENGSAVITVSVNDGGMSNNITSRTFTVTVASVNQAPTLDPLADLTVPRNGGLQTVNLSGISSGAANEAQTLTVTAFSSDTSVVPNPTVTYTSPGTTGKIAFSPVFLATGSATVTVRVHDGGLSNNVVNRTFLVTVSAIPTISSISNQFVAINTRTAPIEFVIGDAETPASELTLWASSSAPGLIPTNNVVFGGSGAERTVTVTPVAGQSGSANITIYVSDGAGTASTTFQVSVLTAPTAPEILTITTTGEGTVSGATSGQTLTVGRTYTLTAVPAAGQEFAGWSGGVASTSPKVTFKATSSMVVHATFVPSPFRLGSYNGLVFEQDQVRVATSGNINLRLSKGGVYSAKLQIGASKYKATGKFDLQCRATNIINRVGGTPLVLRLQLGTDATADQLFGELTDGTWTAQVRGDRAVFDKVNLAPFAGTYTAVLPGSSDPSAPAGHGNGTVSVSTMGLIKFVGVLADGSKVSSSAVVSKGGYWPLFASLGKGQGALVGWLMFTNRVGDDVHGRVRWVRNSNPLAKFYPAGIDVETEAVGSKFIPVPGVSVLNASSATVMFEGGTLPADFENLIQIANNKVVNLGANALSLAFSTKGTFKGKVTVPGTTTSYVFSGVVLQKTNRGYGFLSGVGATSAVTIEPVP